MEKKTMVRFTVRLDSGLLQDMNDFIARDGDITRSQVARKALREFFEKRKKNKIPSNAIYWSKGLIVMIETTRNNLHLIRAERKVKKIKEWCNLSEAIRENRTSNGLMIKSSNIEKRMLDLEKKLEEALSFLRIIYDGLRLG